MKTSIQSLTKALLLTVVLFTLTQNATAQKKGNQITYKGNKYYKGVWNISQQEAFNILKENGESYGLAIHGKKLQTTGKITAFVGGALVGFPIGLALAGSEDPKWFLAGIGGGLILFAIPVYSSGTKKIHQGVELYNETKATSFYQNRKFIKKIDLKAGAATIGLTMTF